MQQRHGVFASRQAEAQPVTLLNHRPLLLSEQRVAIELTSGIKNRGDGKVSAARDFAVGEPTEALRTNVQPVPCRKGMAMA